MDNKQYNLYNLEPLFKTYLSAEKISPISLKNYLSDIRHFFGWLTFRLQAQMDREVFVEKNIIGLITVDVIEEYKSYLTANNLPLKTVNRRLSTLRKFCSFCITQGWLKENPAKHVGNVSTGHSGKRPASWRGAHPESGGFWTSQNDILSQFEEELLKTQNKKQAEMIINDVKEFLSFSDININLSQPVIS